MRKVKGGWTDQQTDRRTNRRTDRPTDRQTDQQTDGCTNGRKDGPTYRVACITLKNVNSFVYFWCSKTVCIVEEVFCFLERDFLPKRRRASALTDSEIETKDSKSLDTRNFLSRAVLSDTCGPEGLMVAKNQLVTLRASHWLRQQASHMHKL